MLYLYIQVLHYTLYIQVHMYTFIKPQQDQGDIICYRVGRSAHLPDYHVAYNIYLTIT